MRSLTVNGLNDAYQKANPTVPPCRNYFENGYLKLSDLMDSAEQDKDCSLTNVRQIREHKGLKQHHLQFQSWIVQSCRENEANGCGVPSTSFEISAYEKQQFKCLDHFKGITFNLISSFLN